MNDLEVRRYVTPDQLILVADVGGPEDAPTIILLHGGGQTRHSWSGSMHTLIALGYRVISYDARGHGDSDWSAAGNYGLEANASDLRTILDTVRQPVALAGASMGGMTAFNVVGSGPGRVAEALVLVDIVLHPAQSGIDHIRNFMNANLDGFANLDEAADAVAAYNPDRPRPRNPAGLMKNLRVGEEGRLFWHWDPRFLGTEPSVEPPHAVHHLIARAPQVTIPVLLVRGERSDVVTDEGVRQTRELVPQLEYWNVEGAGHMVAGDRNSVFTEGMLAFLTRNLPVTQ